MRLLGRLPVNGFWDHLLPAREARVLHGQLSAACCQPARPGCFMAICLLLLAASPRGPGAEWPIIVCCLLPAKARVLNGQLLLVACCQLARPVWTPVCCLLSAREARVPGMLLGRLLRLLGGCQ